MCYYEKISYPYSLANIPENPVLQGYARKRINPAYV